MTHVGIIGAGIAGLHLGLYLLREGLSVTLYDARGAEELGAGRLPNTVALLGATRDRERALGVNHWDGPAYDTYFTHLRAEAEPPIAFRSDLREPVLFIDMRLYLPRLLGDFEARGGRFVRASTGAGDLGRIAAEHDLLVVASGKAGLCSVFPTIPERSPLAAPGRRLFAGLFRGVRFPEPCGLMFQIATGHGEIFENQIVTAGGRVTGLLIEAIPGGDLEPLTHRRYEDDPRGFDQAVLDVLQKHGKLTYARVDPAAFGLIGPLDTLSGAITPVVRRAFVPLGEGRFAVALGDAHITNDPILGQGANAASRAAWLLGEAITTEARRGGAFDEAFCQALDQRLWEELRPVAELSNAFLQPPPPHMLSMLAAAAQNQAIADAFLNSFNHIKGMWEIFSSPESTARFVASFS